MLPFSQWGSCCFFAQVVKKSGIIINPIKFKEVNPHEKGEDHQGSDQKSGNKRRRGGSGKVVKRKAKMRS